MRFVATIIPLMGGRARISGERDRADKIAKSLTESGITKTGKKNLRIKENYIILTKIEGQNAIEADSKIREILESVDESDVFIVLSPEYLFYKGSGEKKPEKMEG